MNEEPESEKLNLNAWEPQAPSADFAEKVLATVRAENGGATRRGAGTTGQTDSLETRAARSRARRWGVGAGAVGVLALAAAFAMKVTTGPERHFDAIAKDRIEVSLGQRARAVMEPGAQVTWDGDDVVQAHGDVFYRVEPGARFRVHTPVGDVEVKGTCFAVKIRGEAPGTFEGVDMNKRDVKSGVVGAVVTALSFVAVYEGKVAVSHAGERVQLGAGEAAQISSRGVSKSGLSEGAKAFDANVAANGFSDEPLAKANESLVSQVSEYRARLEAIATQKIELEKKLKTSEEKLAAADGGPPPRTRSEYDLDQEDWKELAKKGEVKFRVPCMDSAGWDVEAKKLNELGLAPQDAAVLKDAFQRSHDRVWKDLLPMCAAALGTSLDVVGKIGADSCQRLVYESAAKLDKEAAAEAITQAAEVRAGLRPEPGPNDKVHPILKMLLVLTGANKNFEGDLAKSFGPEEAHRIVMSDEKLCTSSNRWTGGTKREKPVENK